MRKLFAASPLLTDLGLLLLRLGFGAMFLLHGWPKITGGPEKWAKLGENMAYLGLDFGHTFWGFMAAFAEFFGALLLMAGLLTRPAAFLLGFTMLVAAVSHFAWGDGIDGAGHALESLSVCLGLMLMGSGRFGVDALLAPKTTEQGG